MRYAFIFILLLNLPLSMMGGDGSSKLSKSARVDPKVLYQQLDHKLSEIAASYSQQPKAHLKRLFEIVELSIQYDFSDLLSRSYYLLSDSYVLLGEGKTAQRYFELYQQTKRSKVTKVRASSPMADEKKEALKSKSTDEEKVVPASAAAVSAEETTADEAILEESKENESQKEVTEIKSSNWSSSGTTSSSGVSSAATSNTFEWQSTNEDFLAGKVYALNRRFKESNNAFLRYQKTLGSEDEQMKIEYFIAQNFYELKDYKEAIRRYTLLKEYEESRGNQEGVSTCLARLSACFISSGQTDKGLELYQNSVSVLKENEESSEDQGYSYGSFEQSKEVVSEALRKNKKFEEEAQVRDLTLGLKNDPLEYFKLSKSYWDAGKKEKAVGAMEDYLKDPVVDGLTPQDLLLLVDLAESIKSNRSRNAQSQRFLEAYARLNKSVLQLSGRADTVINMEGMGYEKALELSNLQKDKELSNATILHLMEEQELKEEALGFQRLINYLLAFLSLGGIITTIYILRVSRQRRIANQQLALRSLRTQMNPHFIFNALNSVNSFISMNDERSANQFLSDFSKLMRTVMENSEHDFIPLTKELEILQLYLTLEHFRFKDKFSYQLKVSDDIEEEDWVIPPMLVQPYIENAIWHGLRYTEEPGNLLVEVQAKGATLEIIVEDDGIGRKKSKELKTKNQLKTKSTAMKNIDERLILIQSLHGLKVNVKISDAKEDGSGTRVIIRLEQPKNA